MRTPAIHGRNKRPDRGRLLLVLGGIVGVCLLPGCTPDPVAVRVDLQKVPANVIHTSPTTVVTPAPKPFSPRTATIEGLPSRQLFLGNNASRLERALMTVAENRQRAYERTLRRLEEAHLLGVSIHGTAETKALSEQLEKELDQAYIDLRAIFEEFASRKGRMPWELANLAGFPDRDPESKLPLTTTRTGQPSRRRLLAKEIRVKLAELDAAYWSAKNSRIAKAHQGHAAELAILNQDLERRTSEARQRARAETDALSRSSAEAAAGSRLVTRNVVLPTLPGGTAQVNDLPPTPLVITAPRPAPFDEQAWTRSLLVVWSKSRGYRIASPGESARDATQEFISWKVQFDAGR